VVQTRDGETMRGQVSDAYGQDGIKVTLDNGAVLAETAATLREAGVSVLPEPVEAPEAVKEPIPEPVAKPEITPPAEDVTPPPVPEAKPQEAEPVAAPQQVTTPVEPVTPPIEPQAQPVGEEASAPQPKPAAPNERMQKYWAEEDARTDAHRAKMREIWSRQSGGLGRSN
jgi:hypothetical protein